jgi:hypothetical protein
MINCWDYKYGMTGPRPFSDSIAPFRFGGWPTINGCGQKKSGSAAYQPSLDQSTTVRKTDTYVLLLSG